MTRIVNSLLIYFPGSQMNNEWSMNESDHGFLFSFFYLLNRKLISLGHTDNIHLLVQGSIQSIFLNFQPHVWNAAEESKANKHDSVWCWALAVLTAPHHPVKNILVC